MCLPVRYRHIYDMFLNVFLKQKYIRHLEYANFFPFNFFLEPLFPKHYVLKFTHAYELSIDGFNFLKFCTPTACYSFPF